MAKYLLDKIKVQGELVDLIARSNGDHVTVTYNGTEQTLTAALEAILADITALPDGTEVDEKVAAAIEALKLADTYEAKGAAAQALVDAKAYTDAEVAKATAAASAAQSAAEAAQSTADEAKAGVSALETYLGEIPEGATADTIVGWVQEKTAGIATDAALSELQAALDSAEGKLDTLIASDTGKSVREIAIAVLTEQLVPADAAEAMNTLEEIAAWIQDHPEDASAMNAAIAALQAQMSGIDGTVKDYVDNAIAALSIGDYAKAADLTALAARVTTAEGEIDTLQTEMDAVEAKAAANETAAAAAKSAADEAQADADAAQSTADTAKANAATAQSAAEQAQSEVDALEEEVAGFRGVKYGAEVPEDMKDGELFAKIIEE